MAAATAFGCPRTDPLGIGSTANPAGVGPATRPTSTASRHRTDEQARHRDPAHRQPSATARPGTQQRVLLDALTGAGPVADADPGLWVDLPVLPVGQPQAVFAVAPDLTAVLGGAHPGWAWTRPLAVWHPGPSP